MTPADTGTPWVGCLNIEHTVLVKSEVYEIACTLRL